MRAVVTRVASASVRVDDALVAAIARGLLVLVGVAHEDDETDAVALARKIAALRIFADDAGAMNRSAQDVGGAILVVSQFTLLGDVRRGRRPSFVAAAAPAPARALIARTVAELEAFGITVRTGAFGATMAVESVNDGPVTILVDTKKLF